MCSSIRPLLGPIRIPHRWGDFYPDRGGTQALSVAAYTTWRGASGAFGTPSTRKTLQPGWPELSQFQRLRKDARPMLQSIDSRVNLGPTRRHADANPWIGSTASRLPSGQGDRAKAGNRMPPSLKGRSSGPWKCRFIGNGVLSCQVSGLSRFRAPGGMELTR